MLLLILLPGLALAQNLGGATYAADEVPPLNAQAFRPAVDSQRFLRTTETATLRSRAFFGRAVLGHVSRPLVYQAYDHDHTGEEDVLVSGITGLDLVGGFSLGRARLAALVPVYLYGSSPDAGETGLGDLLADLKLEVLDGTRAPLGLALSGRVTAPTATTDLPLGTDGVLWEVELGVDRWLGDRTLIAANLG